jgi:hypothetical protein
MLLSAIAAALGQVGEAAQLERFVKSSGISRPQNQKIQFGSDESEESWLGESSPVHSIAGIAVPGEVNSFRKLPDLADGNLVLGSISLSSVI